TALDRAAEVARHWAERDCPVVLHVDARAPAAEVAQLRASLADLWNIRFSRRYACEWGTWSLVAASQAAAEVLLREFAKVRHVYLASGACLPLRPVEELRAFLETRPRTDFIESVTTEDVDWTVGGFAEDRFRLHFPFSWKRRRWLFDRAVELQRRLGTRRAIPDGIDPHLGSQWWCLTRQTLSAVLQDPRRAEFDRYFRTVWIPDESYFQTLVRRYATQLESRALTLAKFDFQGKPHVFYDDHLSLLQRSDCFVARKIWPRANKLYDTFLGDGAGRSEMGVPSPAKIDRVFAKARERRTRGRRGLYMAGRYPNANWENGHTAAPYTICHGFDAVFEGFPDWLSRQTGSIVHGHLYAPDRVQFAGGATTAAGNLTDAPALRDHHPQMFLTNLVWNTRGEALVFQHGPEDRQAVLPFIAGDANARVWAISGAWIVPLFLANRDFADIRKEAARLQRIEGDILDTLQSPVARVDLRIWGLAEFLIHPMEHLQSLLDQLAGPAAPPITDVPRMPDLSGLGQFVENLKNQGMNPHLVGDLPVGLPTPEDKPRTRPYLVR
ncbi:MAG: beta-1,6-N-acetylglucosaminyltransferase, partial [Pseudomonadota bacterium]